MVIASPLTTEAGAASSALKRLCRTCTGRWPKSGQSAHPRFRSPMTATGEEPCVTFRAGLGLTRRDRKWHPHQTEHQFPKFLWWKR